MICWAGGSCFSSSPSQVETTLILTDGLGTNHRSIQVPCFLKHMRSLGKRQNMSTADTLKSLCSPCLGRNVMSAWWADEYSVPPSWCAELLWWALQKMQNILLEQQLCADVRALIQLVTLTFSVLSLCCLRCHCLKGSCWNWISFCCTPRGVQVFLWEQKETPSKLRDRAWLLLKYCSLVQERPAWIHGKSST